MDDNFDEFDEFKNFDRSKLNKLFNDNMSEDEFRDSLKGLIGNYSRDYANFLKMFLGLSRGEQDVSKETFLKNLDIDAQDLEEGYLKRLLNETSDTGDSDNIRFMTFTFGPKGLNVDSDYTDRGNKKVDVSDILKKQLDEAISVEDYEKAAEIRDLITSLKESDDNKKENKDG